MEIIWMIIIGFLAGVVAKFLMPGKDPGGIIITTLIGIAGSLLGSYLAKFIGISEMGGFGSFVAAVIGAFILLGIYRLFKGKKPEEA